jgi:dipeptidyl aminopeptidase/acylaminoacyl peptidase
VDVPALVEGPGAQAFAADSLGKQPGRLELARRLSPYSYVRPGQPAVLTVHGDADPSVPYAQAALLHERLDKAGVPNRLVRVTGEGHGDFSREDSVAAMRAVRAFLRERGLLPSD